MLSRVSRLVVEVGAAVAAALGAARAVCRESKRVRLLHVVVSVVVVELLHRDGCSPAHDVIVAAKRVHIEVGVGLEATSADKESGLRGSRKMEAHVQNVQGHFPYR